MNPEECLWELDNIVSSLKERTIKIKWSDEEIFPFSAKELEGLPANTVLCSSNGGFFLKAWTGERSWLSSNLMYTSEDLFDLLYKASKNGDQLYATSTDVIVKGLR